MNECAVCGCKQTRTDLVDEVFQVDGSYVLVEQIPANVCTRCGEQSVSLETAETVRQAVNGGASPIRSVRMQVFEFGSIEWAQAADATVS